MLWVMATYAAGERVFSMAGHLVYSTKTNLKELVSERHTLSFNSAFEAQDESLKVDRKASHFYFAVFFKTSCWLWNEPLDKFLPAMKHVAWVFGWFEKARFLKFLLVGFTVEVCGSGKKNSIRAQARGQGGAMEAIAPSPPQFLKLHQKSSG